MPDDDLVFDHLGDVTLNHIELLGLPLQHSANVSTRSRNGPERQNSEVLMAYRN